MQETNFMQFSGTQTVADAVADESSNGKHTFHGFRTRKHSEE